MSISINGRLNTLADKYYIKYGSPEQKKIDASVTVLKSKLKGYFLDDIQSIVEFGSYKRDTILPRTYDPESDVDLLIVFKHNNIKVSPGTYRNYLIRFADAKYNRSEVYKDKPTVVLELDHIKYDLVPCYEETSFFSTTSMYIPRDDSSWMMTDPHGFNRKLTEKNKANHNEIKPLIRLFKAWNAKVGYPISSYSLEQQIVDMGFWFQTTLEDYFFAAVDSLRANQGGYTYLPHPKIQSLKDNAKRVKEYQRQNNLDGTLLWLGHILPM
jgi:predicted nucleotidyltransferase